MMNYPGAVAQALLDTGAFKISFDPLFTWTSGIQSPVYCDLRALNSDVSTRKLIVEAWLEMFPFIKEADVIAGTATAGISWGAWVADALDKPFVYVRSKAKEHGTKRQIEGILESGQKVALIEDHISTGGSSIAAVESLREVGAEVIGVFAINTYLMPKAAVNFEAAGVDLSTICDFDVILQHADLEADKKEELKRFIQDPQGWKA